MVQRDNPELAAPRWPAACTTITRNYLPHARILAQSYLDHMPSECFYLFVIDGLPDGVQVGPNVHLIHPSELGIPFFAEMCFKYNILELCTALKPRLLSLLLDYYAEDRVIFLDPDILVTAPFTDVHAALTSASIVLTPHSLSPIPMDGRLANEVSFLVTGIYNTGFIAVRNSKQTGEFLRWWDDRLQEWCRDDKAAGLFVDQKWVDLVPLFFPSTLILRNETYNVAFWNLQSRVMERGGEGFLVNGQPLSFFHFSGFDPANSRVLSKHQDRIEVVEGTALAELLDMYADMQMRNGYLPCHTWPYRYDQFENGVPVSPLLRQMYTSLGAKARAQFGDPFLVYKDNSFFDWATRPRHEAGELSRFLISIYRMRPDLLALWPDVQGQDREAFIQWAQIYGPRELEYDARLVRTDA